MNGIEATVELMIDDLAAGRRVDAHVERLESFDEPQRALVASALVHRLDDAGGTRRRAAFFALQHCWASCAREAAARRLADPDAEVRRMAAIVLDRGEGREYLADRSRPLVDHPDPVIAGCAFEFVESMYPDLARMQRALANPALLPYACRSLARYYSPALSMSCRALLGHADLRVARAALVALILQGDPSAATRTEVLGLLRRELAEARELAGEYLAWHGTPSDIEALRSAAAVETDAHARASLQAAIAAVHRRTRAPVTRTAVPAGSPPATVCPGPQDCFDAALRLLDRGGDPDARRHAFDLYREAEPFEPRWLYEGRAPPAQWVRTREARFRLQQRLFALPPRAFNGVSRDDGPFNAPPASALVAPVRRYPDDDDTSFGEDTGRTNRTFTDLIHVGEDTAWDCELGTVVAIADGQVREVSWIESWGNLVVIEHEIPAAMLHVEAGTIMRFSAQVAPAVVSGGAIRCCSLYAHLGPFICVQAGEQVAAGGKIGSIGRAFTWENGGYRSHLHFAVHLGPYDQHPRAGASIDLRYQGRHYRARVIRADARRVEATIELDGRPFTVWQSTGWVRGYLPKWWFEARTHGWLDPRRLLQTPRA